MVWANKEVRVRARKQDCWRASVRVSISIDATDVASIQRAQEAVAKLAALIPGSSVEITHAGFGRMVAAPEPPKPIDLMSALSEVKAQVEAGVVTRVTPPPTVEPEIPDSLRRVPRFDGNGPLDPSIDAR